jgi:hypothetical protein
MPDSLPLSTTPRKNLTRTLISLLSDVVERANNVEVDAILSGDGNNVDRWWEGAVRDRNLASSRAFAIGLCDRQK